MTADPQMLYTLLNEIVLILDDGDRRLLSRFNLSPARYFALKHLDAEPGLTPSELTDLMLCHRSNTTRLIHGMELDGLLVRRKHENDGRSRRLYLTAAGEAISRQAKASHQRYNRSRFDNFLSEDRTGLAQDLMTLKRRLQEMLDLEVEEKIISAGH